MKVAVCWKWLSLDGEVDIDERWAGVSRADEAALEVALTAAESAADDSEVTVVCLGPEAAEPTLQKAIATGAHGAIRIDASPELDSAVVASALAEHLHDADLVVCGDYSLDRGTGSVPAFLAAELRAAQALGLVQLEAMSLTASRSRSDSSPSRLTRLRAVRRLDGGRREVLGIPFPAVISVEGAVAKLRRAALSASFMSRSSNIAVVSGPFGRLPESEVHPYRPRPRTIPAPAGDALTRVRELLDIGGSGGQAETIVLDPQDAAAKILEQLREWGYLTDDRLPSAF